MSPQVTPVPSPSPSSGGTFKGITLTVPQTSSTSGGDKYELGVWGDQQINPGDLPILGALIGKGSGTTGDDIVKAFASANPVALAEIQRAMYLGGFYSSNKYVPKYGVISTDDISAFAKAVTLAGQSGGSVSDLLLQHAKVGTAAGIVAAQQQLQKTQAALNKPQTVSVPATQDLEAVAMDAFQKVLGKKATPKDAAQFAAMYQSMVAGVQRANIAAQQQAVQNSVGGLTTAQAGDFGEQLANVGTRPTLNEQPPAGVPRGAWDNPEERALNQDTPVGFGDQLDQLQTLGEAVTAASAARTPAFSPSGAGAQIIEQEQPVDASVAAANFARSRHPKAAARTDMGTAIDQFMNIIAGMGGA